ncbi:MAG TPA: VWA domain-containing protein [Candidatus Sulfotelmatobacter sp.]|nr:VWA domain-containing protein [Candidatus Sulfotelmatobacter sp.]
MTSCVRFRRGDSKASECSLLLVALLFSLHLTPAQAQSEPIPAGDPSAPSQGIPTINSGPGYGFTQLDFAQMYLDQQNKRAKAIEEQRRKDQILVASGVVSALDLAAPNSAIQEYNRATTLLKAQDSKEASRHLEKAIHAYPKFVSAHIALGLAYTDQNDPRAKSEFQTASQLDPKFPAGFLNLGLLALSEKDYVTAQSNLEKAVSLNPKDAKGLSALAFAQNGNGNYADAIATVQKVHAVEHRGMANVHYLAASAAVELENPSTVEEQLRTFLSEDPTSPMAPAARQNLEILERRKSPTPVREGKLLPTSDSHTFPNSDRLKAELSSVADESPSPASSSLAPSSEVAASSSTSSLLPASQPRSWIIRKSVDETALFFAVSDHGHMVSDLNLPSIQLRDDGKPPERVVQFLPQSKLPLRLALIIDTSGSVQQRFGFEKHAAEKFLERVLNGTTDLGFVAGFNTDTVVTQDFSPDPQKLGSGVEKLQNAGGTALFDAISLATWKLAAYPEQQRVARVVVVLTDGEDNSSHRSLKQVLHDAEESGVTIYPVSTKETSGPKTDADRILDTLAERTGGESMFPGDVFALNKSLEKLRELIRSRYLLAYKPANFAPNGHYHPITIIAERDGKHLQVHVRKGYYARVEAGHN